MKKILKILMVSLLGIIGGGILFFAISNLTLPTKSGVVDHLSDGDKARLAEFYHLRERLGDEVWPEWGGVDIPVILHNEAYAFLVNYPGDPTPGWVKVPSGEIRGSDWEAVPHDNYYGEVYSRQPITDLEKTPENFTVKVGDKWVVTLHTYEYAAIDFYDGFKDELPGFLRSIFPYRLFWRLLIPNSETYVGALAHESFHAFQGMTAPERLADAEKASAIEGNYPWDGQAVEDAWQFEVDILYEAVQAGDTAQKKALAQQFLAQRSQRRDELGFSDLQIDYEREREWLEGLAKYAELSIQLQAAQDSSYSPALEVVSDPDFKDYKKTERYYSGQVSEVTRMASQGGETRFYYTGFCISLLLDDLSPGWKQQAFSSGNYLEDLLAKAVE